MNQLIFINITFDIIINNPNDPISSEDIEMALVAIKRGTDVLFTMSIGKT